MNLSEVEKRLESFLAELEAIFGQMGGSEVPWAHLSNAGPDCPKIQVNAGDENIGYLADLAISFEESPPLITLLVDDKQHGLLGSTYHIDALDDAMRFFKSLVTDPLTRKNAVLAAEAARHD